MNITHHPEYQRRYLHHQTLAHGCQAAVAAWQTNPEPLVMHELGLAWTPATARAFVSAISDLFQAYNQVLWEEFHYCRQCGGQCCVVDAADVRPFDLIATALLDLAPPILPPRLAAKPTDCIYLAGAQCTWPREWRTIKCWSFYCLGSGPWPTTAPLGALHQEVMTRLQAVVNQHLPLPLRHYETSRQMKFADSLVDPVLFAHTLHTACHDLLVAPLHARFPLFDLAAPPPSAATAGRTPIFLMAASDLYEFITTATETLYEAPPIAPTDVAASTDQLLTDLETLTWIVENEPAQHKQQVQELYQRYADAPVPAKGEAPTLWYQMRNQLLQLLNEPS
ncbi:MAG: hypothetical protein DYG89_04765 [Caldilinea sp. CFX5]|nr:hypothetical protein [Caldilinea sp. CFX5]